MNKTTKYRVIVSFVLVIFAISIAEAQAARPSEEAWTKFSPPGGRFTLMMPSIPHGDVKTTKTEEGDVITHIYSLRTSDAYFGVVWTDYASTIKIQQAAEFIAARNNFMQGVNAILRSERIIEVDNITGREFKAAANDIEFTSRIFVVKNRTYQIAVGIPSGHDESLAVAKFLASFHFIPTR